MAEGKYAAEAKVRALLLLKNLVHYGNGGSWEEQDIEKVLEFVDNEIELHGCPYDCDVCRDPGTW